MVGMPGQLSTQICVLGSGLRGERRGPRFFRSDSSRRCQTRPTATTQWPRRQHGGLGNMRLAIPMHVIANIGPPQLFSQQSASTRHGEPASPQAESKSAPDPARAGVALSVMTTGAKYSALLVIRRTNARRVVLSPESVSIGVASSRRADTFLLRPLSVASCCWPGPVETPGPVTRG